MMLPLVLIVRQALIVVSLVQQRGTMQNGQASEEFLTLSAYISKPLCYLFRGKCFVEYVVEIFVSNIENASR